MAIDKKISELPAATVPLAGTEKFEILQGGVNKQVDASDVGVGGSFVPLTLTGNTAILSGGNYLSLRSTGAEISRFVLDGANNIPKILSFRTVDSMRWAIRIEGDETGSEAGATLNFRRYDDSGVFIDAPLSFNRATGMATLLGMVNTSVAITDAASMDLTAIKHTLTTASATRTFTISYAGDDISMRVVLNATSSVFTFPAGALCVNSDGSASGDNTCSLAGTSGDVYVFAIKSWGGGAYTVVCKNTLQ